MRRNQGQRGDGVDRRHTGHHTGCHRLAGHHAAGRRSAGLHTPDPHTAGLQAGGRHPRIRRTGASRCPAFPSVAALLLLLALTVPATLGAQVALELRGGAAIGNHAPTAAGLETVPGPSWAASLLARPVAWASLYAGYSSAEFGCEEGFCTGRDVRITAGGWGGGVRLHPLEWAWVQAGVARLATSVDAGAAGEDRPPEVGYEAGAGLADPLFGAARLVPAVVYRAAGSGDERTAVVAGEVGVSVRLGGRQVARSRAPSR